MISGNLDDPVRFAQNGAGRTGKPSAGYEGDLQGVEEEK